MTDQPDLFPPEPPKPIVLDPDEVRAELLEILATARDARDVLPWDLKTHRYHRVVFPQMANWLPEEEAEQLRQAFAAEMQRLEHLTAKSVP